MQQGEDKCGTIIESLFTAKIPDTEMHECSVKGKFPALKFSLHFQRSTNKVHRTLTPDSLGGGLAKPPVTMIQTWSLSIQLTSINLTKVLFSLLFIVFVHVNLITIQWQQFCTEICNIYYSLPSIELSMSHS